MPAGEWLSIQEASALLGVAPSTLRRWGDSGRVRMKRTLGGHRRFAREDVMHLAGRPSGGPLAVSPVPVWDVDGRELARQPWHDRLAAGPLAERMRGLGQRLLGLLIQYINRRDDDGRFLREARTVGASYGQQARAAGVSLHDMVEAYLFFRSSFSQLALPLPGIAQPTDLVEAAALYRRLSRFMDAILLGAIAGYEEQAS
jgi:excisionase family DNA binding protein